MHSFTSGVQVVVSHYGESISTEPSVYPDMISFRFNIRDPHFGYCS